MAEQEAWAEEVKTILVPKIIKAHLEGDIKVLKQWLGEAVYSKLAADISTRKHDGYVFDGTILEVDENQLILQYLEESGPVIVGVYMVQQINCIKNRKGEIIEVGCTVSLPCCVVLCGAMMSATILLFYCSSSS